MATPRIRICRDPLKLWRAFESIWCNFTGASLEDGTVAFENGRKRLGDYCGDFLTWAFLRCWGLQTRNQVSEIHFERQTIVLNIAFLNLIAQRRTVRIEYGTLPTWGDRQRRFWSYPRSNLRLCSALTFRKICRDTPSPSAACTDLSTMLCGSHPLKRGVAVTNVDEDSATCCTLGSWPLQWTILKAYWCPVFSAACLKCVSLLWDSLGRFQLSSNSWNFTKTWFRSEQRCVMG